MRKCLDCGASLENTNAVITHESWHRKIDGQIGELTRRVQELEAGYGDR